ncbi:MAG: hypothetical protein ABW076_18145 [Candidatus Thiodiazotropha sp.]
MRSLGVALLLMLGLQGCVVMRWSQPELTLQVLDSKTRQPVSGALFADRLTDDDGCVTMESVSDYDFILFPFTGVFVKEHAYLLSHPDYAETGVFVEVMSNQRVAAPQILALCQPGAADCRAESWELWFEHDGTPTMELQQRYTFSTPAETQQPVVQPPDPERLLRCIDVR